jgi:ubiquinone/menaquinone biosynthesis C-methylase UbiE
MKEPDYIAINKDLWNNKTIVHIDSDFYDNKRFIKGQSSLKDIELNLLGDIKGKSILHLQCHFGQDSISLQRLGAKVTGIDFSDKAIKIAKELAIKTNTDTRFIKSDVYKLPQVLKEKFDLVFTSYGTIGWLPDMNQWAEVVSHFLKPKGKFVIVEFHPVVWIFDDDFTDIKYNYFNKEAIKEIESDTYADNKSIVKSKSITWNHSISEVITSLLAKDLQLEVFKEYDFSPYNCFNQTEKITENKFRIKHLSNKIPMVYALVLTKKIT